MKNRLFGIRWKIVSLLTASIIVSSVATFLLIEIVHILGLISRSGRTSSPFFYNFLYSLRAQIGIVPLGILSGFVVFLVLFFFLSRKYTGYIRKISAAVQKISLGRFDIRIPRETSDELGELAESINRMTARLKEAVDEERNAEKSKNELVTSVSHDLRTPLTSILGYLELVQEDKYRDEVELRRYVDVAYERTLKMKKMIDDLFEYTKVNFGGLKVRTDRIDMKELLEQLAEEFVPAFRSAGMECRLTTPGTSCFTSGDGDLLVRVFENLVMNAIRYGEEGKIVKIDLAEDGEWVTVRVVNFGDPIPGVDMAHIFERFFRAESSRSERTGGSGLGLAISKGIIDLHGGTIRASSDLQDGTVFEVRLRTAGDPKAQAAV